VQAGRRGTRASRVFVGSYSGHCAPHWPRFHEPGRVRSCPSLAAQFPTMLRVSRRPTLAGWSPGPPLPIVRSVDRRGPALCLPPSRAASRLSSSTGTEQRYPTGAPMPGGCDG
jgi:hypothetical protein